MMGLNLWAIHKWLPVSYAYYDVLVEQVSLFSAYKLRYIEMFFRRTNWFPFNYCFSVTKLQERTPRFSIWHLAQLLPTWLPHIMFSWLAASWIIYPCRASSSLSLPAFHSLHHAFTSPAFHGWLMFSPLDVPFCLPSFHPVPLRSVSLLLVVRTLLPLTPPVASGSAGSSPSTFSDVQLLAIIIFCTVFSVGR